jgi:hypothetical protein
VIGYTYVRQNAIRLTKDWNNKVWGAFEVANAQTTLSTSYTPANLMGFNTSSNALSPNGSTLNYLAGSTNGMSTDLMPDLIGKVAFEPGWGHFEIKGLFREFRDRIAATADAAGSTNYSSGGGGGWAAILPILPGKLVSSNNQNWAQKIDFVFEGTAGKGIGRYGAANTPDVTVQPNGNIIPLFTVNSLAGFEFHPSPKLDVYLYGGDTYVGSSPYSTIDDGKLVPAGYGSLLVNNSNCQLEVIPEGAAACGAQNRNLYDTTAGFWYRIWKGQFGTLQYGMQGEYFYRNTWSAIKGGSPTGNDVVGLTSIRFYLP